SFVVDQEPISISTFRCGTCRTCSPPETESRPEYEHAAVSAAHRSHRPEAYRRGDAALVSFDRPNGVRIHHSFQGDPVFVRPLPLPRGLAAAMPQKAVHVHSRFTITTTSGHQDT